jgi:hypothetical protein
MKKQTDHTFSNLSTAQTSELTGTVNETIAMDFIPSKSFTVADLWNVRRSSKATVIGSKAVGIY